MSGKAVQPYACNRLAGETLPAAVAAQRYLGLVAFPLVV
jgi:hypothetical protein